jgi:hypothetical protein
VKIRTPSGAYAARVQELHIKVIHILIELVEREMFPANYAHQEAYPVNGPRSARGGQSFRGKMEAQVGWAFASRHRLSSLAAHCNGDGVCCVLCEVMIVPERCLAIAILDMYPARGLATRQYDLDVD